MITKNVGKPRNHWSLATSDRREVEIKDYYGVASTHRDKCVHWLSGEMKHGHQTCEETGTNYGSAVNWGPNLFNRSGWFDHGEFWTLDDGSRVAFGQPYGITTEEWARLERLESLGFQVSLCQGWWHPSTVGIRVTSWAKYPV